MGDYKFGLGGQNIEGLEFSDLWAKVGSDGGADNPVPPSEHNQINPNSKANRPDNPNSPNYERARGRIPGYQNPILGDSGEHQIKRGQTIKLDALENVIEHIIEYYVRDKDWYKDVRAREALWNMYRRVRWWTEEQLDPSLNQYQRCLEMIKDCIYKILDPATSVDIDDFLNPSGKTLEALTPIEPSGDYSTVENGFKLTAKEGNKSKAVRRYKSSTRGDIIFQYSSDMDVEGRANIKLNGIKVWEIMHPSQNNGYSHRDIRVVIDSPQEFEIEFEIIGGGAYPCTIEFKDMDWVGVTVKEDNDVPYCPLPYEHRFNADYFNHFDGEVVERPLLDMRDLPISDGFPDFFRYVSSTEDMEWEIENEVVGDGILNPVMKIDLGKLIIGNSSKITFNWRFKRDGYIEFEYLASTKHGNGTSFFINERQVGGSWSEETEWKTAKYFISGNQTYKFDLLVRKNRPEEWGENALKIRNLRLMELIYSEKSPAPLEFEPNVELVSDKWFMHKDKSVMATYYQGFADGEEDKVRTISMELDNECDGEISWEYLLGTNEPNYPEIKADIFIHQFLSFIESGESVYGSSVVSTAQNTWDYNGEKYLTKGTNSKVGYEIMVGEDSTIGITGEVNIIVPPRRIDHFIRIPKSTTIGDLNWHTSGANKDKWVIGNHSLSISSPDIGEGMVYTTINMENDGFIEFYVREDLKDGERLQVILDGEIVGIALNGDKEVDFFRIPMTKGTHVLGFNLISISSYEPNIYGYSGRFGYGGGRYKRYTTPGGNLLEVGYGGGFDDGNAHTIDMQGEVLNMTVTLKPHTSFNYRERMSFLPYIPPEPVQPEPTLIYEDNFQGGHGSSIVPQGQWKNVDVFQHFVGHGYGDEVLLCDAQSGVHRVFFDVATHGFEQGYFEFEYGAVFGTSGSLIVKADGTTLWSTTRDSPGIDSTFVRVELPPYTREVELIYYT